MRQTARGFNVYGEGQDYHGIPWTVIESSLATEHAVRVYTYDEDHYFNKVPPCLHLTRDQAQQMVEALQQFLNEQP